MAPEKILDLELAGIRVRLCGCLPKEFGPLEGFRGNFAEPMYDYTVSLCDRLLPPTGQELFHGANQRAYRSGDELIRYTGPVEASVDQAHASIRRSGNHVRLDFLRRPDVTQVTAKLLVNHLDLEHLLTVHNGFLLHASFIEHEGSAILFTAPSETGKSTQAKLWCDHAGAELVNGDRAAVRIIDGEVYACGIPFSGSSPVRRNVTLPLKAIVYLSQAPENSIAKLRGVRSFRSVWEGCTVNVWDREDVEKATKTVSEVVSRIPVYHLACTPDIRAVELLKNTMEVEK